MPRNPEDGPFNTSDLVREQADFRAQRALSELEYRQDLLAAIHEIRDALVYLADREREREKAKRKAETPAESQS